jgi:hypothetical protein
MKSGPSCRLPPLINDCCERFTEFYLNKFKTGRRLAWLTSVGNGDVKVR